MMEITTERFAELIVAEHKYHRLRNVIQERVERFRALSYQELELITDLFFPIEKTVAAEGSDEFPCL